MKKFLSLCLSLAMTLSLLAGCASGGDTGDSGDTVTDGSNTSSSDNVFSDSSTDASNLTAPEGVVAGSTATIAFNSDFVVSQRPGQTPSAIQMYYMVYDTLFWSPSGELGDLDGLLVKEYSVSDDGLVWVLDLHENVDFQTGTHMTAEVALSSLRYLDEVGGAAAFSDILDYSVTGEYQLTFTFANPSPEFMAMFAAAEYGLFDAEMLWETGDNVESCYMIGSGPYYISDYAIGDYMTFTAVEDYWCPERQAHIETIYAKVIVDTSTTLTSIMSGEIDHAIFDDAYSAETVAALDNYSVEMLDSNTTIIMLNDVGYTCEYLSNPRVREALTMMIDVEELSYVDFGGYATQLTNALSQYVDYTHDRTYDPEGGLAILAEEGISPEDIVMTGLATAMTVDLFTNLQSQWYKHGITLNFDVLDSAAASSNGMRGEWDVWIEGGGINDSKYSNGLKNLFLEGRWCQMIYDPDTLAEVSALTNSILIEPTVDDMRVAMVELAELLDENHSYIASSSTVSWRAYSDNLVNCTYCDTVGHWRAWEAWVA